MKIFMLYISILILLFAPMNVPLEFRTISLDDAVRGRGSICKNEHEKSLQNSIVAQSACFKTYDRTFKPIVH